MHRNGAGAISPNKRIIALFFIILAGEAIFMLPFLIPRLYRPLMLEAWGLDNTDIGRAFFAYGITAMISYIFGGPFADKYHPRVLISLSLVLTAAGSLLLAFAPSASNLIVTYEFFGVSTVFLMWGALIKTTHLLGGEDQRSSAMGVLDGGRGLAAAIFSSLLVISVSMSFPNLDNPLQRASALKAVYLSTGAFTLAVAVGVWWAFSGFKIENSTRGRWSLGRTVECFKSSKVWLLSIVILASYCGYKGVDNYSTYLVDVQKLDLAESSFFTSVIFWLRPPTALLAGVLADRFERKNREGRFTVLLILLILGALTQMILAVTPSPGFYFAFSVILEAAAFAYALRAVYFSVFGDLDIPDHLVGTAVGIASFVGFLPDVFFSWMTGKWIDAYPGALGFKYSFAFTGISLLIGAAACFILQRQASKSIYKSN
jgi:MFS family permease